LDELLFTLAGAAAAASFLIDYLRGATTDAIVASAVGIAALVALAVVDVVVGFAPWVMHDAMGLLAAIMFPVWQHRMRKLRAAQDLTAGPAPDPHDPAETPPHDNR